MARIEKITINNLVRLVCEIADYEVDIEHIEGPQGVRGRNSDNTLIKEVLGWAPSISLREGVAKTYSWIEKQVIETNYQEP